MSEEAKKHYGSYDQYEILPNRVSIDKRHAIVHTRQHLDDMVSILPNMLYAKRGWVAGHKFAHEKGLSPRVVVVDWVESGLIKPEAVFGVTAYFVRQRLERLADRMQSLQ